MEPLALILGFLFLPIASVLPAWQKLRREAKNAEVLATDVRTLVQRGERSRALSVLEQGGSRLATTLRDAILCPAPAKAAQERAVRMPVADYAARIFCGAGVAFGIAGLVMIVLEPALMMFLLPFGFSMFKAGTMLKTARMELDEAHRMLLRTVREAA